MTVAEAVSGRMHRQEILADPAITFHFVMMEEVLQHRVCDAEEMLAQLRRIRKITVQENITVGIVPAGAPLKWAPYHGFELVGDDVVFIDVFTTGLSASGRADVHAYRRVFDDFAARSTTDIGQILDRYQHRYTEVMTTS